MAENIEINGTTYPGVESVELNTTDGKKVLYFQGQLVEVVQETGSDETAVMSQKAVTNAIGKLSNEKADQAALTLGYHTDGLIYIFAGNKPLGTGIEMTAGGVSGYVDSDNNIVLNNLPDGTYTVKYEMEDGSTVNIGNLVLDSNVYYSVKNTLTNCTTNNSETQAVQGESYAASITANSGYELSSVVVTMGGVDVTASAVSSGTISIEEVAGDIVITAVATEIQSELSYTNLLPLATDVGGDPYVGPNGEAGYKSGYRLRTSTALEEARTGAFVSGFIPISGIYDVVCIANITLSTEEAVNNIVVYNENKEKVYGVAGTAGAFNVNVKHQNGVYTFEAKQWTAEDVAFFRFSCGGISNDTIVTVNEEIV